MRRHAVCPRRDMLRAVLVAALLTCAGPGHVRAEDRPRGADLLPLSLADKALLVSAAENELSGIALARAALKSGQSDELRELACDLIRLHGRRLEAIEEMAARRGVSAPKRLPAGADLPLRALRPLAGGAAFDRAVARLIVLDRERALGRLKLAARAADDLSIRAWAGQVVAPLAEEHQAAIALERTLG